MQLTAFQSEHTNGSICALIINAIVSVMFTAADNSSNWATRAGVRVRPRGMQNKRTLAENPIPECCIGKMG